MIIPLLVSWITVAIAAESGSSCCVEKEVGTIKYKVKNFFLFLFLKKVFFLFSSWLKKIWKKLVNLDVRKREYFSFTLFF